MIGFVIALNNEAVCVLNNMENTKKTTLAGKMLFEGNYMGHDTAVIISGVGKVNAALATQALIDRFEDIEVIFNVGISGSVNKKIALGLVCLVKSWIQYDFDLSELEDVPLGKLNEFDSPYQMISNKYTQNIKAEYKEVVLGTADRFSNSKKLADFFITHNIDICDMEGASVAQVCKYNKKPVVILKAISDYVGEDLQVVYDRFYQIGVSNLQKELVKIVSRIS